MATVCWEYRAHCLGQTCCRSRHSQARAVTLYCAGRAINNSGNRSARAGDSVVGELLSVALLPFMGVCLLLLRKQLGDGWLWRRDPPFKVADIGATREHYWRIDVRNIRKPSVCDRHPARRPRPLILPRLGKLSSL